MKKLLAAVLIAGMLVCLAACGSSGSDTPAAGGDTGGSTAGSSAAVAPQAGGEQTTSINLMGEDVPVTYTLGDGKFTISYSFNGNDVTASGSVDSSGMMTVEEYVPEDVPEMYVQGAVDLFAEAVAD